MKGAKNVPIMLNLMPMNNRDIDREDGYFGPLMSAMAGTEQWPLLRPERHSCPTGI